MTVNESVGGLPRGIITYRSIAATEGLPKPLLGIAEMKNDDAIEDRARP